MIRRTALSLLALAALVAAVPVNGHAEALTTVTHHMRPASHIGTAQVVGRLPGNTVMQLNVVLQLRDRAGLQNLLAQQYDRQSPLFHQWITPQEFTERFGPTQQDYDAVVAFAKEHGLAVVGGTRGSFAVQMRGTSAQVERAFHVSMQSYRDPADGKSYFAPDREPSADLPFQLWHVSGIDNFAKPHPLYVKKSDYAKAHGIAIDEVVSHATTGSGPSASFLGSDMRAAYYGTGSLTGSGLALGLFEYEGTDLADLTTYYKNVSQTEPVTPVLVSTDGTSTACKESSCDDTEQTLDMTQIMGMAPGLASLHMFIGSVDTAIIGDMTTYSPLPLTIGCSWGWTPADPSTLDPYFEKMATQGQTFFAASGDSSTWSKSNEAWPADDANIISVGGTDLTTASAGGAWKSETAWTDSGGGISPDSIAIPSWQKPVINSSNKGSTTLRNGPDVSANANFTFYVCADQTTCTANSYGGTSFAAPMWAGYIALADQQEGKGLGFIDPAMYTIDQGSSYGTDFHDITSGTSGSYSAVVGYDLVTGIGSPNGANLINGLTTAQTPSYSLSANPSSLSVQQGSAGNSTISVAVSGGFDSAVTFSASGNPTGVTVGFNPTSVTGAGSSTATFTVASTTATGTYPITITGTSGTTVETTTVTLTVTSAGNPAFSISATPSSQSIKRGNSGNYTVTVTGTGGFSGVVTLSATGEGNQQTVSFSPTTVTGSGTSTMTVHAGTTGSGTHTITIKGTSGTTSHTTTVTATITKK
jgi:subtilase family serine protease